jgi:hypothetical protein
MFARALPKSILCLVCGGSFVMATCCFSESLALGKCDDFLGCSSLLHACIYAVCRKDCTSRDTVAQGKALANLIGSGRDVGVQRNKMGSLEGPILFGASRREWRGKGRKKYGEIGELKVRKRCIKK